MIFVKLVCGYMICYLIDINVKILDDLKGFDYEGYYYSEFMSKDGELVFIR